MTILLVVKAMTAVSRAVELHMVPEDVREAEGVIPMTEALSSALVSAPLSATNEVEQDKLENLGNLAAARNNARKRVPRQVSPRD